MISSSINKPLISAIMIVYNGEKYIEKAIDSVLKQTYKNFELLILNDGSIDSTEKIIKTASLNDGRIKYFSNESNKGLSFSRNKIVNLAIGDYIVVTDADDISLPNRFEKQITTLLAEPELSILGSNLIMIDENGNQGAVWKYPLTNAEIKLGFKHACVVANPACIFKKEVFTKVSGYNEKISFCEDWDFFYRASHYFNFKNEAEALVLYRLHDNNMSIKKLEETVVYSLYASHNLSETCLENNILSMFKLYPELAEEMNQKIINFYSFWIDIYTKLGYKKLSKKLFNQVLNNYFAIFSRQEKQLFLKINLTMLLKNFDLVNFMMVLKKYLFL